MTKVLYVSIVKHDIHGLKRTIESIKAQSYTPVQHFIINGGKDRETKEFLLDQNDQVQHISSVDTGIYNAMNKWELAQGEFDLVCWLNAGDCLFSQSTTQKVVDDFEARGWSWLYGNMELVDDLGKPLSRHKQTPFIRRLFELGVRWIPHQATYFEYTFLKQIGFYREDIGVGADQEFLMRAAKISSPLTLDEILVSFSAGGRHTSLKGWKRQRAWQKYRQLNQRLIADSYVIDTVCLPFLLIFERIPLKLKNLLFFKFAY